VYIKKMPWTVLLSAECAAWLDSLPANDRVEIMQDVLLLQDAGPQLGRPQVDHIKGSKHTNMKELRSRFGGHQYRTLFAFDPKQQALLLIGGDKVGQDQSRFYKTLIKQADAILTRHLANIAKSPKRSGSQP
jgi:hypothetical protein